MSPSYNLPPAGSSGISAQHHDAVPLFHLQRPTHGGPTKGRTLVQSNDSTSFSERQRKKRSLQSEMDSHMFVRSLTPPEDPSPASAPATRNRKKGENNKTSGKKRKLKASHDEEPCLMKVREEPGVEELRTIASILSSSISSFVEGSGIVPPPRPPAHGRQQVTDFQFEDYFMRENPQWGGVEEWLKQLWCNNTPVPDAGAPSAQVAPSAVDAFDCMMLVNIPQFMILKSAVETVVPGCLTYLLGHPHPAQVPSYGCPDIATGPMGWSEWNATN
ncbi:hypothetical protein BDQ17DRAFT_1322244 [Cyathus striatus]|nr:hypothetical protein BDQ17DRAFT_1322244 [Cyathus striatus]